MVNMGLIFRAQKKDGESLQMFTAAHEADPRNSGAINNLGNVDFEEGKFEEAAIKFLDALDIKPTDEEALCNLAIALKKTKYLDYA